MLLKPNGKKSREKRKTGIRKTNPLPSYQRVEGCAEGSYRGMAQYEDV